MTDGSRWFLLTATLLVAGCGAAQSVSFLQSASVSGETIFLSDLLPANIPAQWRHAARQIDLGLAPQCNTIRQLAPSEIEKQVASQTILKTIAIPAPISVRRSCFPLRRDAVEQAVAAYLQQENIPVTTPVLSWPESIQALHDNPALRVEQAVPDLLRERLRVRVRCVDRSACPGFWVQVEITNAAPFASARPPATVVEPRPILVRVGQRTTLIFAEGELRIRMPVTCLQPGGLGSEIRAMDPATRRIFRAEVTSGGILMAHL